MKKFLGRVGIIVLMSVILGSQPGFAQEYSEKDIVRNLENFIANSVETDGNYSTISFKDWRGEIGITLEWTNEDMMRETLGAFEKMFPKLEIISCAPIYCSKRGGGIECSGILIRHKTKLLAQTLR